MKKRVSLLVVFAMLLSLSQQVMASPVLKHVLTTKQVYDYVYSSSDKGFVLGREDEEGLWLNFVGYDGYKGVEISDYQIVKYLGRDKFFAGKDTYQYLINCNENVIAEFPEAEVGESGIVWDEEIGRIVWTNSSWYQREDKNYQSIVYDYDGNQIAEISHKVTEILDENTFWCDDLDNAESYIVDINNNVLSNKYYGFETFDIIDGYVEVYNEEYELGIIDYKGNEILPLGSDITEYVDLMDYDEKYERDEAIRKNIADIYGLDEEAIWGEVVGEEGNEIAVIDNDVQKGIFTADGTQILGFGEYGFVYLNDEASLAIMQKSENSPWELYTIGEATEETTAQCDEISVMVAGELLTFDQPPVIVNDRTLVPLRAIFEALGVIVDWDEETQTIAAQSGDNTVIKLQIGSDKMLVNGEEKTLDVPAQKINDRTLVPVRAISESLGCTVEWIEETNTVKIN